MIGTSLVLLFVCAVGFALILWLVFGPWPARTWRDLAASAKGWPTPKPYAEVLSDWQRAEMAAFAETEAEADPPLFGPLAAGLRRSWRWSLVGACVGLLLGVALAILRLAA